VRDTGTIRINVTTADVQKALKKAGYYDGTIDNKVGDNTKKAVTAFQKDHQLTADGIVGKKTWIELKKYLE